MGGSICRVLPYRYLMDMAQNKERVAENYFSYKGRGRFHAIRQLFFAIKKHRHVFKTDIKSYFASIDSVFALALNKMPTKTKIPIQFFLFLTIYLL